MQTTLTLRELYRPIEKDMEAVRSAISDLWADAMRIVYGDRSPKMPAGGKMLRPAMTLLSAGAIGAPDTSRFVRLANAMELLHLAALAHDDVIDDANLRHGVRSLNALWDNHTAVLGGDYLVARAIEIMGTYDSCLVITNAIRSVREMSEGELSNFGLGHDHFSQEACISLARQKTASLFAVACSTPACLIDGAPRPELHNYGLNVGVAFQLVDDLLDLTRDEEALGKPAFGDLVEGKKTLPILFLRESLDASDCDRLDGLKGHPVSDADRAWVSEAIDSSGARERTEAIAREYLDEARAALAGLPISPYRESLLGITEFVLVRGA
ncbi:MAG TPA: polyprenyl synthetase family protein [Candidatus Hydrogenedentes bacterium]|nr:polyprenyl synthetase family protein [Candidatus Hydrogenedentota bacterium]HRK33867.1 polyprenyl synthetase family protein [Candidatus Hydrogenedentota bacterium]